MKENSELSNVVLSDMVHEFKNPISVIMNSVELLKGRAKGDKFQNSLLDMIDKESQHLLSLVNNILVFYKLDVYKPDFKNKCYIKLLVEQILQKFYYIILNNGITVHVDIKDDIFISASDNNIDILLSNLINNAIKYNSKNGKIFISANKNENSIIINVEDTGIGISQEDVPRIFDRFFRTKKVKNSDITGSGLGLSIVRRIVDLYNGKIEVFSKINKGTRFKITFPISVEE